MTKQEIQALIDSKIAGQGTAVDLGGALPTILHEILEAAFAGENVQSNWDENDSASPQFIQNKPTIPAAQVNADWNATEGVAAILNKPTIPAPYSLPVASAETLGGVKVGSGLEITPVGVLENTAASLIVRITFNSGTHIATIIEPGPTKRDIWNALSTGRTVIGLDFSDGGRVPSATCLCVGDALGDAMGGGAIFFTIRNGNIQYAFISDLLG